MDRSVDKGAPERERPRSPAVGRSDGSERGRSRSGQRVPHWQGILIALHLVAITVGSLPVLVDERGLTEETFQDPLVQAEFKIWAERLNVDPEDFGDGVWNAASGLLHTQRALQAPFEPYYEIAGTRQRWRMFPGALENPSRLRIDVLEEGDWRTVYRLGSHDPGEQWLAKWFDRDRFRAALNLYAWDVYPEAYEEFVTWLAKVAADDFPTAERIRVGYEVVSALSPEEARAGIHREPKPWEEARQTREVELVRKS